MAILNQKFDITKPIISELGSYAVNSCNNYLSDVDFDQCIREYGIENEDDIYEQMQESTEYQFIRRASGWDVKEA